MNILENQVQAQNHVKGNSEKKKYTVAFSVNNCKIYKTCIMSKYFKTLKTLFSWCK